jgi:hypothetical protein
MSDSKRLCSECGKPIGVFGMVGSVTGMPGEETIVITFCPECAEGKCAPIDEDHFPCEFDGTGTVCICSAYQWVKDL